MDPGKKVLAVKQKNSLALSLAVGLFASQALISQIQAKRPSFLVPTYNKLVDGAGPATNDMAINASNSRISRHPSIEPVLTPVTLDARPDGGAAKDSVGSSGTLLKTTITATGFVPKGPVDSTSKSLFAAPQGISDKLSENLKKAKDVNLMPLPLLMSADEEDKKVETIVDAEKAELAELWESTLARSPDIQFVVQKLMPTSNPGHASTIIMRMLSSAVFGAMGAMNMITPNVGMYAANSMGASMIMNVLQMQESKAAKNAKLSQTEAIMLYNMVRGTADRLVENFRNYKKTVNTLNKANTDLQDLQGMVAEARGAQDASKQVEMEYTLRKAQRDVDVLSEDLRRCRQSLVDLAGSDALAKLDKQIEDEQSQIEQATPSGTPNSSPDGNMTPNPQTAANPRMQG